jgi:hypothetical protein
LRTPNPAARTRLITELCRHIPASAPDLAARLEISVPTLHRMLREQGELVFSAGAGKNTRHAARRPLRGTAAGLPVYRIDREGRGHSAGMLELTAPHGSHFDLHGLGWPVGDVSGGWWEGLPYPFYDMRPQGYLGRNFARRFAADLGVSSNPNDWSDDDAVYVLARRGDDAPGDLIIGDATYEKWLETLARPAEPLPESAQPSAYAELAERTASLGEAGSSVAGEFPKFTASRELTGAATPHVLVKFSGADDSTAVRRWADLLVCEHLALETLQETTGLAAARSRILQAQGRTFLEVERFDRHGMAGRSAACTLAAVNGTLLGSADNDWGKLVEKLAAQKLATSATAAQARLLWWYGRLIANTDMHLGNLGLNPAEGHFSLAPAYDMLPMFHAPLAGGEVPARTFEPALPLPPQRETWLSACRAALLFWQRASTDSRIGEEFRAICAANRQRLEELAQRV